MTWKRWIITALAMAVAMPSVPPMAQEIHLPETLPIAWNGDDPGEESLGELTYRGGLEIAAGADDIGGISSITWHDGQLFAVTIDGRWMAITPDEIRGQLIDLVEIEYGPMLDTRGKRLKRRNMAQPGGITAGGTADTGSAGKTGGDWIVTFAQGRQVWAYSAWDQPARDLAPSVIDMQNLFTAATSGEAMPISLARWADGWLACGNAGAAGDIACFRLAAGAAEPLDFTLPDFTAARQARISDVDCASNTVCYILLHHIDDNARHHAAIIAIGPDGLNEVLANWSAPYAIAEFDGLAVREENGATFLYILSNNGLADDASSMLIKFEVSPRAATTPGVAPKIYETTDIIIETTLGEIKVRLESERAPITVANFLRYIDEDRYDGTKCYRAMRVPNTEAPSGFLQCGTQNHPARILPPIAHEPTSQTGLSHRDGALSMARFEPGTATGDFSIMIQDQPGLDANPTADDPALRPGFAVFGYVVEGMDIVHAIHATRIDPDQGEGFLKGQMLAEPTEIIDIRRATAQ